MADELQISERQFYWEPRDAVGDNMTVAISHGGSINIDLEEPWAGDTESGFGARCSMTVPNHVAHALADWIKANVPLKAPSDGEDCG